MLHISIMISQTKQANKNIARLLYDPIGTKSLGHCLCLWSTLMSVLHNSCQCFFQAVLWNWEHELCNLKAQDIVRISLAQSTHGLWILWSQKTTTPTAKNRRTSTFSTASKIFFLSAGLRSYHKISLWSKVNSTSNPQHLASKVTLSCRV